MQSAISTDNLEKLAAVSIHTGLNLQEGQELVITAPLVAQPLVRKLTETAYKAGATLVSTIYSDEADTLARYAHAPDESFETAPGWLYEGMAKAYANGAARLAVAASNPMLLSEADPDKVSRANKANSTAAKPAMEQIVTFKTNWSIISYPHPDWAKLVFPDLEEEEAVNRLAESILSISRVDTPDPVAAWADHDRELHARADWLNGMNFAALKYAGPGTDLTLGLAEGHRWMGGSGESRTGIRCIPNIPTEEVFTTPHAGKVDGTVSATKPLSYNGTLIEDISVRFEGGRIVEATASKGESVLKKVLETDEGAARLGEVALVPHSSPISQSGLLFYNTLYDENAACHIALGQCYAECFKDEIKDDPEKVRAAGGNESLIHIDWMIGSDKIDIDGITQDGRSVPVFRSGEWAD